MATRHVVDVHVDELDGVLRRAYELASFERRDRPFLRATGVGETSWRASAWAMDMRIPLSSSDVLRPIAVAMVSRLNEAGLTQVAGLGYASFPLVGAIVAHGPMMTGGFIREAPKGYGFGGAVEGALVRDAPVVIVDDVLNRGRSALRAAAVLREEGFTVLSLYTVFRFGWADGRSALRARGLGHRCLATLHRTTPRRIRQPEAQRM